jgi:hypothetical protein
MKLSELLKDTTKFPVQVKRYTFQGDRHIFEIYGKSNHFDARLISTCDNPRQDIIESEQYYFNNWQFAKLEMPESDEVLYLKKRIEMLEKIMFKNGVGLRCENCKHAYKDLTDTNAADICTPCKNLSNFELRIKV